MWCDNLDGKPDRVEKCKFSTGSRRAPNPSVPSTTQYRKGKSVPKLFLAFTLLGHIFKPRNSPQNPFLLTLMLYAN